ncbi:MAG: hypothetical protein ACD_76C00007G0002 [uncultured bacterium]|nr:MAG: hypothetical protein ACD_76C00007G0002 [uncultured bacterium]HBD05077.1 hypothetical protein [Candidatus Uhrbacteria bacterium]
MNKQRQTYLLFRIRMYKDQDAFAQLHKAYYDRVFRFILLKTPTRQDAEDIANDTFVRLWRYITTTPVTEFTGLVYKISQRTIAAFYRERGVESVELDENVVQLSLPGASSIEMEVDAGLQKDKLLYLIGKLKDEYKDALFMRYVEQMSVAEIAEALDKRAGGVRVLLHRAKKALHNIIEENETVGKTIKEFDK